MHVTPLSMTVRQLLTLSQIYIYRMPQADRERAIKEERGRGVVRALYTSELTAIATFDAMPSQSLRSS